MTDTERKEYLSRLRRSLPLWEITRGGGEWCRKPFASYQGAVFGALVCEEQFWWTPARIQYLEAAGLAPDAKTAAEMQRNAEYCAARVPKEKP